MSMERKEEKTRAQGRQLSLGSLQDFQGEWPWTWQMLVTLNMKLFLFSSFHINTDWTQSQGWSHGKTDQWITKNNPQGLLLTRRHFLKVYSVPGTPIHYLISPWQRPWVAVGWERLHNLLKISGLARRRGKFEPGSIRNQKCPLSTAYHSACPPVMSGLSESAGGLR